MEFDTYQDTWDDTDPHANFKAEVAAYTVADPLPTLENLSKATGVPVPSLIRYVLVKYVASGSDALLAMTPIVLRQMQQHIDQAETANTDAARLRAYEALRQMIAWLSKGAESVYSDGRKGAHLMWTARSEELPNAHGLRFSGDKERNYGVVVNPNKAATVTFSAEDMIIVIADE